MFLINSTVYVNYVYMLIWDSFNVIPLFLLWMRTYHLVRCISSSYKTYVVNLEDVFDFRFSINNCNTIYSSRYVVRLTHAQSYEISMLCFNSETSDPVNVYLADYRTYIYTKQSTNDWRVRQRTRVQGNAHN